ncbi:MAG: Rho termination factor N-terminal domain-containing protein, partial [Verrucomicrobiota bacterium]|nr:Rho termination factor N-terminal domain-containing protein [Verrucomicrobiota bacterium]
MKRPVPRNRGSRKKKSNGLAATEAAAVRNRYLRAYGNKKAPTPKIEDIEDMELSDEHQGDGESVNMSRLQALDMPELNQMAKDLDIPNYGSLQKHELIFQILQRNEEKNGVLYTEGVLEILPEGFGFLRSQSFNYLP